MYHVTDLGERYAVGLNNSGQIAGNQYAGENVGQQPFLYSGYGPNAGQVSVLPGLAAAGALGPGGQVSGITASTSGPQKKESIVDGSNTTVLAPPSGYLQINGINASGQRRPGAELQFEPGRHYRWRQHDGPTRPGRLVFVRQYHQRRWPGCRLVFLPGNATSHAFLYSGGRTVDLGTLGGPSSAGFGMNAAGDVVGQSQISQDGSPLVHAFLSHDGRMTDLGALRND